MGRIFLTYILLSYAVLAGAQTLRDYSKLNHTITLTSLRAGNHDPSGKNSYFFKLTQFALANTKEERLKELPVRKKIESGSETFATLEIESLSYWQVPETDETLEEGALPFYAIKVEGDSIRKATAAMMQQEKMVEEDIAHMVTVDLYERNKKYFVLNEDRLIASTTYYPVPPSSFDGSERTNQTLQISDDQGTMIKLSVTYDEPLQVAKSQAAPPPTNPNTEKK